MVLGSGPFSDGDSFIVQTQAVTANAAATAQEPCATQAFGPSRLGQRQGYKSSILGEQVSDGEPDLPPATQPFAPSKFGGRTASGGWGYESESEDESSSLELDVSSSKRSNKPPLYSAKEVSPSPTSSPRMRKNATAISAAPPSPAMQSDRDSDDAYVHFDPENKETFLEPLNLIQKPKKNPTPTREERTKTIYEVGTSPKARRKIRAPTDASDSPRPSTPKAKPKRSRKKAEDEFDETWELELKEKISEDRELHLRILRYEVRAHLQL
ncbi:hypothetical protein B0H19DRAFT_1179310 [Mycena capillaripes]|nr:hypothetical protein B0H19DRAFT_1179310 [Mycena capillaripes]